AADSGRVYFNDELLVGFQEYQIAEKGIGRKFQKPTVFERLSVCQNLILAGSQDKTLFGLFTAKLRPREKTRIDEVLLTIGLADCQHQSAGILSHGQKQWLEIGMLLMMNPTLLLIDEPVAGMTHQEMDKTAELFETLAGMHSLMIVEHDMGFIRRIARTVTVLNQGQVLAEGTMDEVQANPDVIQVYLGEESC
ncbi:MAG: ATP-binding cassette domain-containing protein, partial [Cellvibrionales bacterium]|nr:ATP-binding cassette domain-containing protein [Cellvibrionales bacterium]